MCHFRFHVVRLVCLLSLVGALLGASLANGQETESNWFDRHSEWHGFDRFHFSVADHAAYLVVPPQAAPGKPWIWRARFPDYHAEMDVALVQRGFHVAYVDLADLFGAPRALDVVDRLYDKLTTYHGLSSKVALEGVSRGGLFIYNWAARHPERVACIYADTPVLDIKSWPGGRGNGLGSQDAWQKCLKAYGFDEASASKYDHNPIDHAALIAQAKIPLLHIVSENDQVVPPAENTYVLKQRLQELGHELEVISLPEGTASSHGHHFDHPDPERVVAFIERHAAAHLVDRLDLLKNAKRIVFLGDSITFAGDYVDEFATWLLTQNFEEVPLVINVGLPSETVSGLSEEGHAGGRFPRPDLAERLERVLETTQPDLVFACYGINCGIYQPFDENRFRSYQQGIENLRKQVRQSGATLVLITPPTFDDQRAKKPFAYNDVLDRYSDWLLRLRKDGAHVIDLHGPMSRELAMRRQTDSDFTFQPDAVHPNADGHWLMAQVLIGWFGDANASTAESPQAMLAALDLPNEVLDRVNERQTIIRDAYLSASGHKRPGIAEGLPLAEAKERAEMITIEIRRLLQESR